MRLRETSHLLLFPMPLEAASTVKRLRGRLVARERNSSVYRCDQIGGGIEIVITGTGKSSQNSLQQWLLNNRPNIQDQNKLNVALFGFAGSLVPEMQCGDVYWFSDCGVEEVSTVIRSHRRIDNASASPGRLITVPSIVASMSQRILLHQRTRAVAADMETYWLCKILEREQLEFGCCRVISDDMTEDIPTSVIPLLQASGRVSQVIHACGVAWRDQQAARWMIKMYGRTKSFSRKLADQAEAFCSASM